MCRVFKIVLSLSISQTKLPFVKPMMPNGPQTNSLSFSLFLYLLSSIFFVFFHSFIFPPFHFTLSLSTAFNTFYCPMHLIALFPYRHLGSSLKLAATHTNMRENGTQEISTPFHIFQKILHCLSLYNDTVSEWKFRGPMTVEPNHWVAINSHR